MKKQVYITEEEREKCHKVIDAFAELCGIEDEDILFIDAGRCMVLLNCSVIHRHMALNRKAECKQYLVAGKAARTGQNDREMSYHKTLPLLL